MNLNAGISLKFDPKAVLPFILRIRSSITFVAAIALLGFTGYQVSRVVGVQPDAAYVAKKQAEAKTTSLKIDKKTLAQLKGLQSAGDTNITVTPGKTNPFNISN